jgi:hypothetical protein
LRHRFSIDENFDDVPARVISSGGYLPQVVLLRYAQFFACADRYVFQLENLGPGLAVGLDVMHGVIHDQTLAPAAFRNNIETQRQGISDGTAGGIQCKRLD